MADREPDGRYGLLNEKLVAKLKNYEYEYFREDKPVPFCGLLIYPILVRDMEVFTNCSSCLTLEKNKDKNGVRMTHLDYLLSKTQIKEKDEGKM